jgi:hypothetical protein
MKAAIYHRMIMFALVVGLCHPGAAASPGTYTTSPYQPSPRLFDYDFNQEPIPSIIQKIAETECMNVMFDDSVGEQVTSAKLSFRLSRASPMRALEIIYESQGLNHEYIDARTLIIFRGKVPEKVKPTDILYRSAPLVSSIAQIGQAVGLKTALSRSAQMYQAAAVSVTLRDVSLLRGLELILDARRLTYEHVDCDTILIFPDESVWLK